MAENKEPKLIDYDLDTMSEDEAKPIAMKILQQRIEDCKQNAQYSLGCSIFLLLIDILIFHDVSVANSEIGAKGIHSIMDSSRYKRILKLLKNGTNKMSSVDYLKMFRAEQSVDEIWQFVISIRKKIKENTADFSGIWKHIDCYEDYCKDNPKFKNKRVNRAIETINELYHEYGEVHPQTAVLNGNIEE